MRRRITPPALTIIALVLTSPVLAFDDLYIRPPATLAQECVNGYLDYRIGEWKRRDRPPDFDPSSSVETIMSDMDPRPLRALADRGCSNRFRYNFLACTKVDWPEDRSSNILPIGVTAATVVEMTEVIRGCLKKLEDEGIAPVGTR